jgi:hypothetical protein
MSKKKLMTDMSISDFTAVESISGLDPGKYCIIFGMRDRAAITDSAMSTAGE